jgi:hypothetical protein
VAEKSRFLGPKAEAGAGKTKGAVVGRNQLSDAGRLRCRETGQRNIAIVNARRETSCQELSELAQGTREGLLRDLGPSVSAAQRVLVEAAVVGHLALHVVCARFQRGRAGLGAVGDLIRLQSETRRSLSVLGLIAAVDERDSQDGPSIASLNAEYAARSASQGDQK